MTTTTPTTRRPSTLPTLVVLARRALVRIVRLPSILIPVVVMPVFFVVAFTGSFEGVTRVEGFPTDNFINWVGPYALVQTAAFAGIGAAGAVALDLDNGFIDRLLVAPIRRSTIIVGPLVYTAVRSLIPVTLVLVLSFMKGASVPGGPAAILMAYLAGIGGSLVLGCLGLAVVLHIGSIRAMTVVQIFAFAFLFPSIGQVPIALMDGWLEQVARVNPATNLIRMARQGFIGDVTWADTWPGLLVIALGIAVFGTWARYELERQTL